jgi:hypothetical protein
MIMSLWEHMDRLWTYCNNRYHKNTNQQVARYKMEELNRRYDEMWEKHTGLIERIHNFQAKHFENRQQRVNLNYKIKRCWVNLAEQYINEGIVTNTIRDLYSIRILGRKKRSWLNWSRPSSLSGVLWLPFCLFWFKQISVAQAQLK